MKLSQLSRKQKKMLVRIISGIVLLAAAFIITHFAEPPKLVEAALFLLPFIVAGYDVVWRAVRNIGHGQVFDENFLMTLATIGAMAVGEYSEGAAVMLFYQVGELFQNIATANSRRSVAELMDIRPDTAAVVRNGETLTVDPSEVAVGETIVIKPGEKVPLDCIVKVGSGSVNTAALTGESLPREVSEGSEVLSGCINLTSTLTCTTTKPFGESTVSKILELVENASSKKARAENFITKFARIYTPCLLYTSPSPRD